jgi:putative aldouronate transport system substrate-binding protein
MNRRKFLKLVGTSAMGSVLLAACGGTPTASTTPEAANNTATTSAEATTAPVVVTTAAETQATTPATAGETVELRYVYTGNGAPQDLPAVQEALSALVQQKGLNATIKLEPIEWGAYNDKVGLMNTSGEAIDVVYTAPWINNYYQNVANGNLMALDEFLPAYAPKLWASMTPETWNAARVSGKVYGVINQQIFVKPFGPAIRKDLAEKYQLDIDGLTSYDQLTPFMQQVKDGEADIKYAAVGDVPGVQEVWGYDPIDQGLGFAAVRFDDTSAKVVNWYTTPEFKQFQELVRGWDQAGLLPKAGITREETDGMLKAGQAGMIPTLVVKPGGGAELKAKYNQDFVQKGIAPLVMTTGSVASGLNAISANSAHPEQAMQFLELLNTDPEVYNLLAKGIEGTHWVWKDEAKQLIAFPNGVTADNSPYNPGTDWMFGNQFNAYYVDESQVGTWEETKQLNAQAKPSPILGFVFDRTPVETELAQVSSVNGEIPGIVTDTSKDLDTALVEVQERLKQAGVDTVLAEIQKQIDAWKASAT